MSKYLLREFYELCPNGTCEDLLTEEEKKMVRENKAVFLTGVMQRADAQNGNGRIYPKPILEREMENYKKLVKERRALGVWWDGNDVMGKVQVLGTPSGQVLKELVNAGVKLGISSRGLGSVSESQGKTIVEDDFQLICFDFVSEPSTQGAFMMTEGKDINLDAVFTKGDKINRALNDILRDE